MSFWGIRLQPNAEATYIAISPVRAAQVRIIGANGQAGDIQMHLEISVGTNPPMVLTTNFLHDIGIEIDFEVGAEVTFGLQGNHVVEIDFEVGAYYEQCSNRQALNRICWCLTDSKGKDP